MKESLLNVKIDEDKMRSYLRPGDRKLNPYAQI
jgi:hypothetical protein